MGTDPTRRISLRKRKPFSDCTNIFISNSSSSVPIKPNPSPSPFNNTSPKPFSSPNTPSNPTSPPSPILSTHSLKSSSLYGTGDFSIKYSRRRPLNQRKNKGKVVVIPVSSIPNLKISNSWEISGRVEGANVSKAKALTVPLRKKHYFVSSEQDVLKDPVLHDFIEKQRAYFEAIDEFKLSEEVEYGMN